MGVRGWGVAGGGVLVGGWAAAAAGMGPGTSKARAVAAAATCHEVRGAHACAACARRWTPHRGSHSLETMCLLLALKLEHPRNVHLIRGNHEAADINALFGFR